MLSTEVLYTLQATYGLTRLTHSLTPGRFLKNRTSPDLNIHAWAELVNVSPKCLHKHRLLPSYDI